MLELNLKSSLGLKEAHDEVRFGLSFMSHPYSIYVLCYHNLILISNTICFTIYWQHNLDNDILVFNVLFYFCKSNRTFIKVYFNF